jgi:hypothetical protein
MLPKNVSVHTLRAVFNATYDALVTVSHMKEPQPAQEVAAFIAAEERKREKRYGYFPKLHPSEYMDEPAQRTWVGLTDEEKLDLLSDAKGMGGRICGDGQLFSLLEEHEAKLKEKNT